jgi:hypothetical protein
MHIQMELEDHLTVTTHKKVMLDITEGGTIRLFYEDGYIAVDTNERSAQVGLYQPNGANKAVSVKLGNRSVVVNRIGQGSNE